MIRDINSTQKDDASFSATEQAKEKALSQLMKELETGMYCRESFSEEEAKKLLQH